MRVGILGGTGPAGRALAARLASVGLDVVIGSRSADRAETACAEIREKWPGQAMWLEPGENRDAAKPPVVVVATPWDAAATTAESVAIELAGKVVISMANAVSFEDGEARAVIPPLGSVAAGVQDAVPDALVAAAFHHLPARSLGDVSKPIVGDVLICSDSDQALETAADLVRQVPSLRPLNAGPLASAAAVEAFTAVLLSLNKRYRARTVLRLDGIPD